MVATNGVFTLPGRGQMYRIKLLVVISILAGFMSALSQYCDIVRFLEEMH